LGPIIEAVAGRSIPLILVAALAASCGVPLDEAADLLSPTATASRGPSPTLSMSPEPTVGEPAIVVRTPASGDELRSPITVSGTANVFEATVAIRLLDADGQVLAASFATATCGSGCRGAFAAEVAFFVEARESGTIVVFEPSAEDGSPLHAVTISVVLVPGV
jgi:hypothetical protein